MAELLGSKKEADKFQYKVTAKTYGPTMKEVKDLQNKNAMIGS